MATLWWTRTEGLAATDAALALLTDEEREQHRRFLPDRKRHEYLVTRVLVRTVLGEALGRAPGALRFVAGEHGRPALVDGGPWRFNVTHTEGFVGCLVSDAHEVGVDVEAKTRAPTLLRLAPTVFSLGELSELRHLPEGEQPERAVRLWTLKESYIKARGLGLALPLEQLTFFFDGRGEARLQVDPGLGDDGARWQFRTVEHDGFVVSTCVEAPAGEGMVRLVAKDLPLLR